MVGNNEKDDSLKECTSIEGIEKSDDHTKTKTKDKITEIIKFQKSNGLFDLSDKDWTGSLFEEHLGLYNDVEINLPLGIDMKIWITVLAMEILEIKMDDEKDLWYLVVHKSKNYLKETMKNENKDYNSLIDLAEKYVKSK